jgi:hypothetical protein
MKVTKENVPTIAIWAGLASLVIGANLSAPPPRWLTVPAWLILGAGIGVRISAAPNDSPYKQASAVLILPQIGMANSLSGPVFLLATEPSLAHLFLPRPFHVLAIVYLSVLCVLLSGKIQRLQSDMVDQKQRYADLLLSSSRKEGSSIRSGDLILPPYAMEQRRMGHPREWWGRNLGRRS